MADLALLLRAYGASTKSEKKVAASIMGKLCSCEASTEDQFPKNEL